MKKKLEDRLASILANLRELERDDQALRMKKYYAEGQKVALQDALSYLKEEGK